MIYFGFNITNPWFKRWDNICSLVFSTPFKNKFFEVELLRVTSILSFTFRLTTRQDHSGLWVEFGLLTYSFNFHWYDNRHWNDKEGCYFNHTEEKGIQ